MYGGITWGIFAVIQNEREKYLQKQDKLLLYLTCLYIMRIDLRLFAQKINNFQQQVDIPFMFFQQEARVSVV